MAKGCLGMAAIHNFWVDLDATIKTAILLKAVENGWLKGEFVKEFLEGDERDAVSRKETKGQEKR